jgi:hypothetical protein
MELLHLERYLNNNFRNIKYSISYNGSNEEIIIQITNLGQYNCKYYIGIGKIMLVEEEYVEHIIKSKIIEFWNSLLFKGGEE